MGQKLEGAEASNWHVTDPVLVLETSTEDAASAYGNDRTWGQVRVTDPYNGIKDGPADPLGYGYKLEVSDESVIKVNRWAGLYAPRQLTPGTDPVRAVITITRPDGSQRQMLVLVTAKAAKEEEEEPEPSTGPEPEVGAFTVTTRSFSILTSIYDESGKVHDWCAGRIRITDPYWSVTDQAIDGNALGYTFISSDPSLIQVDANGTLSGAPLLAPNDEPLHATITVTNQRDGSSVQIPATVSPDPDWYAIDDDYIAVYAAEARRLVNELRAKAGLKPYGYMFEVQECINARSAELAVKFSSSRPNGKSWSTILPEFGFDFGVSENEIRGYCMVGPEELANYFIMDVALRSNMLNPLDEVMAIGLYRDESGMLHSAMRFAIRH